MKRDFLSAVVLLLLAAPMAMAEDKASTPKPESTGVRKYTKPEAPQFLRIRQEGGKPAALQVAIVTYRPIDGSNLEVKLYGAVHVGDAAYYKGLQSEFEWAEALLYEFADDPAELKKRQSGKEKPNSMLAMFQFEMSRSLGLTNQLEQVAYNRPNFVHADMTFPELFAHAKEQGDGFVTVVGQSLLDVVRMMNRGESGPSSDNQTDAILSLINSDQDPRKMKAMLAEQMASQMSGGILEGVTVLNRYLIGARNGRCMEKFEDQVKQGRTKIGIFYGAGHNSDFHRRLMTDYGLRPVKTDWVDAWDLKAEVKVEPSQLDDSSAGDLLLDLLTDLDEVLNEGGEDSGGDDFIDIDD